MSKCLGHDISVRQHSKSEHWAPCHIQTPSQYDWKIVESDVKPKSNKQTNNSKFILMATSLGTKAVVVTKVHCTENFTTKKWNFSDKKFWYFSCFSSKHRLWVLVRTALTRPTICVLSRNKKNKNIDPCKPYSHTWEFCVPDVHISHLYDVIYVFVILRNACTSINSNYQ